MTEIEALRVCLQGFLQERNVVVHCPSVIYDTIKAGFGNWENLVSNKEIAEAAAFLRSLREAKMH